MESFALQQRLTAVRPPVDPTTEAEVRELVWAFVDEGKAAGWPPERIIVAIKQIAREAGLMPTALVIQRNVAPTLVDKFLVDMVGWCIHRYFRVQ